MRKWIVLLVGFALAACGEGGGARPSVAEPAPPIPVPTQVPFAPTATGGENVRGQSARALIARFGPPTIDLNEGTARKLQFAGPTCVLDVYLYPPGKGRDPVATYLDTRLRDGRPAEVASCVAALRK